MTSISFFIPPKGIKREIFADQSDFYKRNKWHFSPSPELCKQGETSLLEATHLWLSQNNKKNFVIFYVHPVCLRETKKRYYELSVASPDKKMII